MSKYLIPRLSDYYRVISLGRQNCDVYCDLKDNPESIHIPENADVVIHVAAQLSCTTDEEMIETEAVNAIGTLKVCMAAYKANVKHVIIISSMSATIEKDSPYYSVYSISKKHSEELAILYCKTKNIPLSIIRPSQIYDSKGYFRLSQPLLYTMADQAESGSDITIYGSNDALRNYIHVEDLVEAIFRVVHIKCLGVFNCIYPEDLKLSEISRAAFTTFNNGGKIVFDHQKNDIKDNIFTYEFDLYEKINYFPQVDIHKGMKKIFNFRKKNGI